jgi:4,5-DOPA dioxygenase extradiol
VSEAPVIGTVGNNRRRKRDIRAPVLFISHGSPLALVENEFKQALRSFGAHMRLPKAVLVVSAHWPAVRPLRVTGSESPATMHDYDGFPTWLSSVTYRCPGSPAMAERVVTVLGGAGLAAVVDPQRGLDSGAWCPLSLMYPSAQVPVLQLSIPAPATPEEMLAIGAAVAPLRREGMMLVGSGGIVHNPSMVRFDARQSSPELWAMAFDEWMRDRIEALDIETLCQYRRKGPQAHLAAPTSEHLDPLFFSLGARLTGDVVFPLAEGFHAANLSLRSFVLKGKRSEDNRLPTELTLGA